MWCGPGANGFASKACLIRLNGAAAAGGSAGVWERRRTCAGVGRAALVRWAGPTLSLIGYTSLSPSYNVNTPFSCVIPLFLYQRRHSLPSRRRRYCARLCKRGGACAPPRLPPRISASASA
jgi:hypothetical protein